ncbi:MAG: hypothetical protein ACP5OA_04040 [Candidatus Woesearchaeota archaeon]
MSVKQSLNTVIDAYNEGFIPSGLYYPGVGNAPMLKYPVFETRSGGDEDTPSYSSEAKFSLPTMLEHFKNFTTIFNVDGSLNPKSSIAEAYAISLALEKKYSNSIKMFDAITANGFEIPIKKNKEVPPVVNNIRKLGFEGIIQYADACMELDMTDKAKTLYEKLVDLPRDCYGGIRYGDVRVEALEALVHNFRMKSYNSLLMLAKKNQW